MFFRSPMVDILHREVSDVWDLIPLAVKCFVVIESEVVCGVR